MIWLLALLACDSADDGKSPGDRTVRLVYSADMHGEIEPCG